MKTVRVPVLPRLRPEASSGLPRSARFQYRLLKRWLAGPAGKLGKAENQQLLRAKAFALPSEQIDQPPGRRSITCLLLLAPFGALGLDKQDEFAMGTGLRMLHA
jgi:hypothetical protein